MHAISRHRLLNFIRALPAPLALLIAWQLAVQTGLASAATSAKPLDVVHTIAHLVQGPILHDISLSVKRLLLGTAIGACLGVISALALAQFRRLRAYCSPSLQFLAGIPVVIWLPFCAMLFRTDETFKIAVLAIASSLLVYGFVYQAILITSRDYLELARMYEKTAWQQIRHILVPTAAYASFSAIRAALAIGWIVLFFVEYGSARVGHGGLAWFIADARHVGRVEDEMAGLLLLGCVAFLTDSVAGVAQRTFVRWVDRA